MAAHSPRPPPPRRTDRGRQESRLLGVLRLEPPLPASLPLSPRARWLSDSEISAPQLQKNSRIPSGSTLWAGRMAVEQTYSRGKDLRKHALRVRRNVLEELVDGQRLVLPARRLASGQLRGLGPRCSSAATKDGREGRGLALCRGPDARLAQGEGAALWRGRTGGGSRRNRSPHTRPAGVEFGPLAAPASSLRNDAASQRVAW
jgi:hypothetical protein